MANKLCVIVGHLVDDNCGSTCKFGFQRISDEVAVKRAEKGKEIVTHGCLFVETMKGFYKIIKKSKKKKENDIFIKED